MKTIAWALIWIAISYAPDINYLIYKEKLSEGAMNTTGFMWFIATIILLLLTLMEGNSK